MVDVISILLEAKFCNLNAYKSTNFGKNRIDGYEQESNMFKEALKNINHFFPDFFKVVNKIDDPRHQSYIKYKESDLIMVRLLGFMCHFSSTTFCYVSNFNITIKNVTGLVQHGRNRWKIENKSFNDMKNHGYHLSHAFSYNSNAIQGHFVILMIACLMMQLLEYKERVKNRFTTIRKMGMEIKE